jgi:hypothetical protein
VEGDNWILDGFEFVQPEPILRGEVYVWRARNPVNGIEWFNGCLKYLKREAVFTMKEDALDFFHSIEGTRIPMPQIATETRFNSTPFLAWRCGFRECAKLSSGSQTGPRVKPDLRIWQMVGRDALNGTWCMFGARMGAAFGRKHSGTDVLRAVNDMDWLKQEFEIVAQQVEQGKLKLG